MYMILHPALRRYVGQFSSGRCLRNCIAGWLRYDERILGLVDEGSWGRSDFSLVVACEVTQ